MAFRSKDDAAQAAGGPSSTRCEASTSPSPSSRNIVLCFDGTTNTFSSNLTSIPVLFSLLSADPKKQLCYYQTGIGTYEPLSTPSGWIRSASELIDEAVAWNLPQHVQDGYSFLMQYYQPGDQVFLFGFSRGAFTARALAGMLEQVGLLFPGNNQSVSLAYHIYSKDQGTFLYPGGETMAEGFKRSFARDVEVHFIGVFDTVASVGAIVPRTLPFAQGTSQIHVFRHALSLDERRARFAPQLWMGPTDALSSTSTPNQAKDSDPAQHDKATSLTSVQEVFFFGAHSDVGGGNFSTDGDLAPRASHIPLKWMIREAFQAGLRLDEKAVYASPLYGLNSVTSSLVDNALLNPDPQLEECLSSSALNPHREDPRLVALVQLGSRRTSYQMQEALAPRGDALSFSIQHLPHQSFWQQVKGGPARSGQRFKAFMWWLLEINPTLKIYWDPEGQKGRYWSFWPNNGQGRLLPLNPTFHESVKIRLQAAPDSFPPGNGKNVPETKYKFKARFAKGQGVKDVTFVE